MKRTLTIILVLVMTFTLVTAVYAVKNDDSLSETIKEKVVKLDSKDEQKEDSKAMKLSLQDAIDYALEHNRDMKIKDIKIKQADVSYDKNKHDLNKMDDLSDMARSMIPAVQRRMNDLGGTERLAELQLNIAKWNKDLKINEIKYNVEKAYYDLSQALKGMEIAKEGLDMAQEQYDQGKQKYELGTISKQDLLGLEVSLSEAKSGQRGYEAAKMNYEMKKMDFNNTLGLPLDQDIILTDEIAYREHEAIDIEESVENALDANAQLKAVKENYEISKILLEATNDIYPDITFKYREQEAKVEEAAKNVDSVKNMVEMGVRKSYLGVMTLDKQIQTYQKSVEQAQKSLELAELSFKLGQSTSNQVTAARINLMNTKNQLSQQIHDYNLALLNFKYSKGLGKSQIMGGGI